jgi:MFS family permease
LYSGNRDISLSKFKIPKQVLILGLVSLFTDIASEMLYPVTPIFLTVVLGSSMAVVGLIEGIAEATAGLLKGYFGILSDKLGKRSVFIKLGYGISALSKPLPGIFPFISTVIVSRTTDRVGKGIRTAPRDALLGSYSKENSGAIFGFHRAMDTLGAAIGPLLALLILYLSPDDYKLVFLVAFIPSAIAVTFTFIVRDQKAETKKSVKKNFIEFWKNAPKKYKTVLVLITIFSLVNSSDVFLILKSNDISQSGTLAILSYVFYNLVYAGFSFPLGKLSDKFGKAKIFSSGLLVFSLVYLGFAISSSLIIVWILFAFYGLYSASTEGISKAWISDFVPNEQKGTAIGLLAMLNSLAIMLGSLLTGVLWDQFGSSFPFLISSSVSLIIALIIALKFFRKR